MDFEPFQDWQELSSNEEFDASGRAWLAPDEAISFERHDHLVDRRRADTEVALHVCLGRRPTEHVCVSVDEG